MVTSEKFFAMNQFHFNNKTDAILKMRHTVKSYDIDSSGKLSMKRLLELFQETAHIHANLAEGQWNFENLIKKSLVWVMIRQAFEIIQLPVWGDEIVVETYTNGISGAFATRNWRILNNKDKIIISSMADWMLKNFVSRKMERLNNFDFSGIFPEEKVLQVPPFKIAKYEAKYLTEFEIRKSDVDVNKHVNNTSYVCWATDSLQDEDFSTPFRLDVNYLKETSYPGKIEIMQNKIDLSTLFLSMVSMNSTEHCRMLLKKI